MLKDYVKNGSICLCQVKSKNFLFPSWTTPGPAPRPMEEMMPQVLRNISLPV